MSIQRRLDKLLLMLVYGLFIWFFVSSLSIAYHRAPQQDDAMFATVIKNFLQGEGWTTNYGEKILFNPDLTAGPALLLPAAPLIILFGNESWIPAITGALVNIALSLLILHQFHTRSFRRPAIFLAFLLSLSLFAVNDFKTFTGYYSSSLLFLLALLLTSNPRYKAYYRLAGFGVLAAIGLYTKPLILLSFIAAFPLVIIWFKKQGGIPLYKSSFFIFFCFFIALAPWHLYKISTLEKQGDQYQRAYQEYNTSFFEHHGSGIAQFKAAANKVDHLKKNTLKNTKILQRFLKNHLGIPLAVLIIFSALSCFYFAYKFLFSFSCPAFLETTIAVVVAANLLWFVCFSFALTPGHVFFAIFLAIFLFFYLITLYAPSVKTAIFLCLLASALLLPAHKPLIQAYSFRQDDPALDNSSLENIIAFIDGQTYEDPLASCGYANAPWRIIYLRQGTDMVVDCYHLLEDALQRRADGGYQWGEVPDFVLIGEAHSFFNSAKSQAYVLKPLLDLCSRNVLYQQPAFGVCRINGPELSRRLDPTQTAWELSRYQQWYRTRLKI